jgi:cytidyltransferase-like protein
MIVPFHELRTLRGAVTMVDGGFDPLHAGHIRYFEEAAKLGLPVLCNVSPDAWVAQKHPPLLPQEERVVLVDAIRHVSYVHASATTTVAVLRALRPRLYAKGADWCQRLPEEERAACDELGVELVFLDTVLGSSTDILRRFRGGRADE